MSRPRILFADNIESFRKTRAEFLVDRYDVLEASTPKEAEICLRDEWVHLAILDIRMMDDNNEKDVSGLNLAKNEAYRAVPKIMLTAYPTFEFVREAMGRALEGLPPAVDFIAKQEGSGAMLQAVENAFAKQVRINWDLAIQFKGRDPGSFVHLVTLLEPHLTGERLSNQSEELTDLFRRLFFEMSQIRIDRPLWQKDGRIALTVFAFKNGAIPEAFVVVCGQNAAIKAEAQHYRDSAPKASGNLGTILSMTAETTHFAANAYSLAGANLETVHNLKDLFRADSERSFHTALNTLLQQTLAAWHQEKTLRDDTKTLAEVYRERISWSEEDIVPKAFEERMGALLSQFSAQNALQGVRLERSGGLLTVRFHERTYTYPDPISMFFQEFDVGQPVLLMKAPGALSGDNILADAEGRAWVTDFAYAGLAPVLWNGLTLEAALRFDWVEAAPLQWLHAMDQCLANGDFTRLDQSDLEAPVRKVMRAIQIIRRAAAPMVGNDPSPYHLGMLFQIMHRLMEYDPSSPLTAPELTRFTHVLIAAAIIRSKIGQGYERKPQGIQIDRKNKKVRINGSPLHLSRQQYELLGALHDRVNKPCERREIFERVFKQPYDQNNESLIGRLDTAIHRLREKIEVDPSQPRYLRTEQGGYRLVLRPNGEAD